MYNAIPYLAGAGALLTAIITIYTAWIFVLIIKEEYHECKRNNGKNKRRS